MISLLIKPASGTCNLQCNYCFYHDLERKRDGSKGKMTLQTLELLVKSALEQANHQVTFAFQGGEPTLASLPFYKALITFQNKYNTKKVKIHNAIQTNGTLIDDEWAQFLAEHHFLVGLSLDGDKDSHELNRGASFSKAMRAAKLFCKHGTEFNILCVVTAGTVRHAERIYEFYKKNGFGYLQFIPCLDGFGEVRGQNKFSLTPKAYGDFLIRLFDLWYADFVKGNYISIRLFDNYIHMLAGYPPESCGLSGICSCYFVVEADGSIYPCDFYVLDDYQIGKVGDSFDEMKSSDTAKKFVEESTGMPEQCKACEYVIICRNGCKRDRENGLNYFCEGYKAFFAHALPQLSECAMRLK